MFSYMLDDALCIDRDAEFALASTPLPTQATQATPAFGDASLITALAHEADVYDADPTGGTVSRYA